MQISLWISQENPARDPKFGHPGENIIFCWPLNPPKKTNRHAKILSSPEPLGFHKKIDFLDFGMILLEKTLRTPEIRNIEADTICGLPFPWIYQRTTDIHWYLHHAMYDIVDYCGKWCKWKTLQPYCTNFYSDRYDIVTVQARRACTVEGSCWTVVAFLAKWSQHQGLRHEMIVGKMQPIEGIDIEYANHCRLLYLASRTWSGTSAAEMRDRDLLT